MTKIQVSSSFFIFNTFCRNASLRREQDENRSTHIGRIFTRRKCSRWLRTTFPPNRLLTKHFRKKIVIFTKDGDFDPRNYIIHRPMCFVLIKFFFAEVKNCVGIVKWRGKKNQTKIEGVRVGFCLWAIELARVMRKIPHFGVGIV